MVQASTTRTVASCVMAKKWVAQFTIMNGVGRRRNQLHDGDAEHRYSHAPYTHSAYQVSRHSAGPMRTSRTPIVRLEPTGETSIAMNTHVAYQTSGALTSRAPAKIIDSTIGPALADTDRNLREYLVTAFGSMR